MDTVEDKVVEEAPETPSCVDYCCNEAPADLDVTHDSTYWKFLDELEGQFRAFLSEARAGELNKSAALRARKSSVNLRKSLKEYREVSTAHDKTHGRKNKKQVELNKEIEAL